MLFIGSKQIEIQSLTVLLAGIADIILFMCTNSITSNLENLRLSDIDSYIGQCKKCKRLFKNSNNLEKHFFCGRLPSKNKNKFKSKIKWGTILKKNLLAISTNQSCEPILKEKEENKTQEPVKKPAKTRRHLFLNI